MAKNYELLYKLSQHAFLGRFMHAKSTSSLLALFPFPPRVYSLSYSTRKL